MPTRPLSLGRTRPIAPAGGSAAPLELPAHHLVTHGVCVGMTGSGKTGLCIALVEEALRSRIPVLLVDVKGDLTNLALAFDALDASSFAPWIDADSARREGKEPEEIAGELATKWKEGLASWGLGPDDVRAFRASTALRIVTPGTTAGEPLDVLSPLEQRSALWDVDEEAARESLSAALSLLMRMVHREPDPARGREHVLLAHLAERQLKKDGDATLEELLADLRDPPIQQVGALSVDEFLSKKDRAELAQDMNALVASPTFATWRQGAPLDVAQWMTPTKGPDGAWRTPATIVSVAHLEDEERMLVLSLVLEQALAWVRGLPGTSDLRALILFDEVFGFLPPHPANPPTKRPLLSLLKQARAFGVGCVLATQNPIDLDYKALSNAGVWFIGRLQTDADRERVVEGLVGSDGGAQLDAQELGAILKSMPPRTFFLRDVHAQPNAQLLETRWTLSWLRGPMTRQEIRRWRTANGAPAAAPAPAPAPVPPPPPPPSASRVITTPPPDFSVLPDLPDGWLPLFPFPPKAPTDAWEYAPHAAIIARAEIADARAPARYRESRRIALLAPLASGTLDVSRLTPFSPEDLRHAPVTGARFQPLGDAMTTSRGVKALEKALRDQALLAARATVLANAELDLVSKPGETREAFAARCAEAARARAEEDRAAITRKYDPKLQKLSTQTQAAPGAVPALVEPTDFMPGGAKRMAARRERAARQAEKAREKQMDAMRALTATLAERDAKIQARTAEVLASANAIESREIVAKKDALTIEQLAIAWLAV